MQTMATAAAKTAAQGKPRQMYGDYDYVYKRYTPAQKALIREIVAETFKPRDIDDMRRAGITFNRYRDLMKVNDTWLDGKLVKKLWGELVLAGGVAQTAQTPPGPNTTPQVVPGSSQGTNTAPPASGGTGGFIARGFLAGGRMASAAASTVAQAARGAAQPASPVAQVQAPSGGVPNKDHYTLSKQMKGQGFYDLGGVKDAGGNDMTIKQASEASMKAFGILFEFDLIAQLDNMLTKLEADVRAITSSKRGMVKMDKVARIMQTTIPSSENNAKLKRGIKEDDMYFERNVIPFFTTSNLASLARYIKDSARVDPASAQRTGNKAGAAGNRRYGGSILQRIVRIGQGYTGKFEVTQDHLLAQYGRAQAIVMALDDYLGEGRMDFQGPEYEEYDSDDNEVGYENGTPGLVKRTRETAQAARQAKGRYGETCGPDKVPLYYKYVDDDAANKSSESVKRPPGADQTEPAGKWMIPVNPFVKTANGRTVYNKHADVGYTKCAPVLPTSGDMHRMNKKQLIAFTQALLQA